MASLNLDTRHHIAVMMPIIDDLVAVNAYLVENDIPAPKAKTEQGFKARLLCPKWWRRTLDRLNNRNIETDQINTGKVGRTKRQKYASDVTVKRVQRQVIKSAELLGQMSMVSSAGDIVDMGTIVDRSLSNPVNRRSELMVRMAGFEAYAVTHNLVGEFYTLTVPSKYHALSGWEMNPKHQHNPKEAQIYLCGVWANIRKKFDREGIRPFGFRVAEPHRDGCPHWHMLLFIEPASVSRVREIMADYLLQEDGEENGAAHDVSKGEKPGEGGARFKAVAIDTSFGSATGYIAKYISKNLGFSLDDPTADVTTESDAYGQRVKAWASVWGIRQFQQIGGAPVTVWRELRKLDEQSDETIEAARIAADESRWADYLEVQGGAIVPRDALAITLVKKKQFDSRTGEMKANAYAEVTTFIMGVASATSQAITRLKTWVMTASKDLGSLVNADGVAVGVFPLESCQ